MNRFKILIGLFFIFLNSYSQNINWQWARADGPVNNNGREVHIATYMNNSIYITGGYAALQCYFDTIVLNNSSPSWPDFYITKYDSSGNALWSKTAVGNLWDVGRCVATQYNGNVYLSGTFGSDTLIFDSDTLFSNGNGLFFAKYDGNGNLIWVKKEGGVVPNAACFSIATDILGFYATGWFQGTTFQTGSFTLNNLGTINIFLIKYDANGNAIWAKSAGGVFGDESYFVVRDLNDNAYISGVSQSAISYFSTDTLYNPTGKSIYVAKYLPNGNVSWVKGFDLTHYALPFAMANDNSGNLYLTGYYDSTITFGNYTLQNIGYTDVFLTKIDTGGNVVWAKNIGDINFDVGSSLVVSSQGQLFLAGAFNSFTAIDSTILNMPSQYPTPMFVATFDTSGNLLCVDAITSGGDHNQCSLAADNSGNVYLSGSFPNTSPMIIDGNTLSPLGNQTLFLTRLNCPASTSINNQQPSLTNIQLFPNPTNGNITINLGKQCNTVSAKVFSVTGKEIFYNTFDNTSSLNFYLNASAGFYIVEITAGEISSRVKVVVND